MKRARRYSSPQDKLAALRRHLVEKTPVSDLCDELGIQPTILYQCQKQLFENGAAAPFRRTASRAGPARDCRSNSFWPRPSSTGR